MCIYTSMQIIADLCINPCVYPLTYPSIDRSMKNQNNISICPLNTELNAAKTHAFVQVRTQPAQKAKLAQKLPGGNDKEKRFHMVSPQVPVFKG